MGKYVADAVLDAALDYIIDNSDTVILCEGEPADYNDATTLKSGGGHKLGDASITTSEFSKSTGDVSGRKMTIEPPNVTVDEAGSADHVALVDDNNSLLLHVATVSATAVSVGEDRPLGPYEEEIEDPT